jgi:hypothetical protein
LKVFREWLIGSSEHESTILQLLVFVKKQGVELLVFLKITI